VNLNLSLQKVLNFLNFFEHLVNFAEFGVNWSTSIFFLLLVLVALRCSLSSLQYFTLFHLTEYSETLIAAWNKQSTSRHSNPFPCIFLWSQQLSDTHLWIHPEIWDPGLPLSGCCNLCVGFLYLNSKRNSDLRSWPSIATWSARLTSRP
jgi:hypothetical protein